MLIKRLHDNFVCKKKVILIVKIKNYLYATQ